jgi:uncharacterized protein (TIGR02594 family)
MNYEISHPEMLSHAFDFFGIKEVRGEKHNPRILSFFEEIGFKWVQDDETAWCSAFINYLAKKCGYERSGKLNARSWLNVGETMKMPTLGDIVVFWRESPDSWKGHVGIFIRHDGENIWTLGGNQSNSVCISPYSKDRLIGYRKLSKS